MSGAHGHSHHRGVARSDPGRYAASRRVTWVSVVVNVTLTFAQVIVGIIGHSQALVADAMHTLSDLITDGMVLFALKYSAKEPDAEHPYGHGRIETAMTLILGVLLLAVGVGIAVRAGIRLFDPASLLVPAAMTFWVASVTLIAKEGLYRYLMRAAKRYRSDLLAANAWHSRSDAVSSLVVVVGIGGSLYGFTYLDAIAAIIVALMIGKIGLEIGWRAIRELIDTGVPESELAALHRLVEQVPGVRSFHDLRTRRVGGQVLVDVHIIVNPRLGVSEGYRVGEAVRKELTQEIDSVSDVLVHIDAEEHKDSEHSAHLPLRDELLGRLAGYFEAIPQARSIERVTLHYLKGCIDIELLLPLSTLSEPITASELTQRFAAAAHDDRDIGHIELMFH